MLFQDPHEELKLQNVLMVQGDVEQTAAKFGLEVQAVNSALQKCRQILFDKRQERPKPHLDNKMVSAWNGIVHSRVCVCVCVCVCVRVCVCVCACVCV